MAAERGRADAPGCINGAAIGGAGPLLRFPVSRAISSAGRAPARQAGGHWFEPSIAHSRTFCKTAGVCVWGRRFALRSCSRYQTGSIGRVPVGDSGSRDRAPSTELKVSGSNRLGRVRGQPLGQPLRLTMLGEAIFQPEIDSAVVTPSASRSPQVRLAGARGCRPPISRISPQTATSASTAPTALPKPGPKPEISKPQPPGSSPCPLCLPATCSLFWHGKKFPRPLSHYLREIGYREQ